MDTLAEIFEKAHRAWLKQVEPDPDFDKQPDKDSRKMVIDPRTGVLEIPKDLYGSSALVDPEGPDYDIPSARASIEDIGWIRYG